MPHGAVPMPALTPRLLYPHSNSLQVFLDLPQLFVISIIIQELLTPILPSLRGLIGRGPKKCSKNLGGPLMSQMSQFFHGWDTSSLEGGEGANGKKLLRGPPAPIFCPREPNLSVCHLLQVSRGPILYVRRPWMARGPLFQKHCLTTSNIPTVPSLLPSQPWKLCLSMWHHTFISALHSHLALVFGHPSLLLYTV